jgi:SAM-dependent methyltransferase
MAGFPAFAPEYANAGGGFEQSYFADLARLEAGSFWFRSRNRLVVWALQHYFPAAKSFFEIGCGTGFVLAGLAAVQPDLHLVGSEIFVDGLGFAAKRLPGAELLQMDARRLPYHAEFDVIGAFDVLEHIVEDDEVLREIHRAMVPGGGLLLTVPQHAVLWSAADVVARHVRRYAAQELRTKCERTGFEILRLTSFVSLLSPLMLVSRLWKRGAAEGNTELAISRPLDRVLEHVMDAERALICRGIDLPFGGSLLLVARKG